MVFNERMVSHMKIYIVFHGTVYTSFYRDYGDTVEEKLEMAFTSVEKAREYIKLKTGILPKINRLKIKDKGHNLWYEYYLIKSTKLC
jgi:hypothetical protein